MQFAKRQTSSPICKTVMRLIDVVVEAVIAETSVRPSNACAPGPMASYGRRSQYARLCRLSWPVRAQFEPAGQRTAARVARHHPAVAERWAAGAAEGDALPVRGQRTHTNARTRKGPRRGTVANKKKATGKT